VENKRCKFGARLNVKGWGSCREVVLVILTSNENLSKLLIVSTKQSTVYLTYQSQYSFNMVGVYSKQLLPHYF